MARTGAPSHVMRALTAIRGALIGPRRIDADKVDQLLDQGCSSCADPRLAALLRAASAPGTAAELADEPMVIAAFIAARAADAAVGVAAGVEAPAEAAPRPGASWPPSRRRWLGLRWAIALAATVALVFGGGTVYAASATNLPERLRQYAHQLFDPSGSTPAPAGVASSAGPRPTAAVTATASATPDRAGLCRAWQAAESDGRAMGAGAARNLADLAGGADRIAAFCATLPSAQPSSPGHNAKPAPTKAAPPKSGPIKAARAKVTRRTRTRTGQA